MSFDPEAKRHELEQARADLQEAEQEILKVKADARVRAAEDDLALLEARFNLRICEMKVGGNEFVGAIEARKNLLAVDEARRKVEQLEQDARTHAASNEAALAALVEKRRKAMLAIGVAERHIESMTVTAPISGLVMIHQNQDATGGFFFMGMTIPDYREGDTVQPGSPVAAIVDLSAIEVNAKIDETARTALSEGAVASVQIDGMPATRLDAKAARLGGVAGKMFFWEAGAREFDAAFRLDRPAPVLRSGMTAALVASADPVKNALHLPRQALFEKEGKPVMYARRNGTFVPVEVKVLRLTESRVVVDGISADEEVALSNPERSADSGSQRSAAPPVPAVGG
jgi:biotin carboxyl carrier protein